jgi:hypothetical protein
MARFPVMIINGSGVGGKGGKIKNLTTDHTNHTDEEGFKNIPCHAIVGVCPM